MDFWGFGVKKNPGLIPWKLTWTLRMGSWKIWKWYFSIGISNYIGGSSIFRCHTSSFRGEQMGPPGITGGIWGTTRGWRFEKIASQGASTKGDGLMLHNLLVTGSPQSHMKNSQFEAKRLGGGSSWPAIIDALLFRCPRKLGSIGYSYKWGGILWL